MTVPSTSAPARKPPLPLWLCALCPSNVCLKTQVAIRSLSTAAESCGANRKPSTPKKNPAHQHTRQEPAIAAALLLGFFKSGIADLATRSVVAHLVNKSGNTATTALGLWGSAAIVYIHTELKQQ